MRPVTLFRVRLPVVMAVSLALAACTSATPSLVPVSAPASEAPVTPRPSPMPASASPAPMPSPTVTAVEDPATVDDPFYREMPINLEMTATCGLCGPESWLLELPRFRLYADGLAVFRAQGDDASTAPYRVVQLGVEGHAELVRYALDEGGLRGAGARYPGNADDAGTIRFALHAQFVDDDADVDVEVWPVIGRGTTDTSGNPIEDMGRREQFEAFAQLLTNFDGWLADHGAKSRPFVPANYVGALTERFAGDGQGPWPWQDIGPDAFAEARWGMALARLTPAHAEDSGIGAGGGSLGVRSVGDGRIATILVRPLLPGDDRPGAFGLRPDTVAVTIEPGLRVRSRPEVSEASVMYEPLLAQGDALYVISGPVEGSGYDWYEVHAPRAGHTGWVAAAAKTGEDWIVPAPLPCTLGASPDEIVDKVGYDLMHLACYSGVEFSGTYRLAPLARSDDDELTCPDMDLIREPDWLNAPFWCLYEFGPEEPSTGGYDLPAGGVLHPSLADVPSGLLESSPKGLLVEVTGQLDHPDTRGCEYFGDDPAELSLGRLKCRTTFVITGMRPAD